MVQDYPYTSQFVVSIINGTFFVIDNDRLAIHKLQKSNKIQISFHRLMLVLGLAYDPSHPHYCSNCAFNLACSRLKGRKSD